MDFEWSDELRSLRGDAAEFGRKVLGEGIRDDDRAGRFPLEKWQKLAEWGYFGLCVPEDFGGAGHELLAGIAVNEGLGEGCPDGGLLFSATVQAWVVLPALLKFGSEEQLRRWVPPLASGAGIGAFAITEPDSGSDAFAMRTRAEAVDGGWRLNGRKSFVTNGPIADVVICFAASGQSGAIGGTTAFIVEKETDGYRPTPSVEKMGLRTSPLGDLVFDDAVVAEENVLGKVGGGFFVFNEVLEWERIWPMAVQLGALERELAETSEYARQRVAFGAPIGKNQAVAHRLVEMKVRLESARLLLYRAAAVKAAGRSAHSSSSNARHFFSESESGLAAA